ncbi:TssN family type VI secretion system protein [Spirosoma sp.]|uniref:TssN family type VI secretion system protein n=1 Tax=Spirosoma sp. TaxID=1899569 RepID=UPI002630C9E4|nr:TssN family type VI secretion system protein [Spirosoma sp.]MCX6218224.1 TssN family type VI secretion system protein [Spirosoma sp.]
MNVTSPFIINYIILLLIAVGMTAWAIWINRQNELMANRRLLLTILIGALILTLPSLFGLIGLDFIPVGYIVVQVVSLVLGVLFLSRMLVDMGPAFVTKPAFVILLAGSIICFGAALFTPVFYYLSSFLYGVVPYDLWAATSLLPFILPILFAYTFNALVAVPSEIYKLWYYPRNAEEVDMDEVDYFRLTLLEVQIHKHPGRKEPPIKVKARSTGNMAFGTWFQKLIDDYNIKFPNDPIRTFDESAHEYGWSFYSIKPSLFRLRNYIDFEKTIAENNLSENHLIVAKRVEEFA